MQDDETDKEAEVAKMADSGAYVTISAASSKSAHEGFLEDRKLETPRRSADISFRTLLHTSQPFNTV